MARLRPILLRFLVTRGLLFALAAFAVLHFPIDTVEAQGFHLPPEPHPWLEAWARYDACWYVAIAERGYRAAIGPYGDMRPNFFPLFPFLTAAVTKIAGSSLLAALIVSNACYLVFVVVLWELVALDWTEEIAHRTVLVYLVFPSTLFLSGAYGESLMLAATTGALLAARQRHWWLAGTLAAIAALSRPLGCAAVIPVLIEAADARRSDPSLSLGRMMVRVVAPTAAAIVGYCTFAAYTFGTPFAVTETQAEIRGPVTAPWQPFVEMWQAGPQLHAFNNSILDAALAIAAVATLPVLFRRARWSYAAYAVVAVVVPLSGSLMSFNRMLLASFPHAILLASLLRTGWTRAAVITASAVLLGTSMVAFATWHWVA
jgi:hypothetical protein